MSATAISVEGLRIGYGGPPVLEGLSLAVEAGETLALLGPSGCGKTTLLKAVAGLISSDAGDIRFDGKSVMRVPAEQRNAAMVFQKPLLFPHLNVSDNVAFGLRMRGVPLGEQQERVRNALQLLHVETLASRKSGQLSGGQEQRVALARALVTEPRVLLLDEPFSALDASLRAEMWDAFSELQRRLRVTTLFVTHDQNEAVHVADRIALMLDGRIEQAGAPVEFYRAPKTINAARFFGWQVLGEFAFRPEMAQLVEQNEAHFHGVVEKVINLGGRIRVRLRLNDNKSVEVERPWNDATAQRVHAGQTAGVLIPEHARLGFSSTFKSSASGRTE